MRTPKSPLAVFRVRRFPTPDATEEVWAYLAAFHSDDETAERRADIEGRVKTLAKLGRDAAGIYAALLDGLRAFDRHRLRLRSNESARETLAARVRARRDIERALKSVEAWCRGWDDDNKWIESLRELRREFQRYPFIDLFRPYVVRSDGAMIGEPDRRPVRLARPLARGGAGVMSKKEPRPRQAGPRAAGGPPALQGRVARRTGRGVAAPPATGTAEGSRRHEVGAQAGSHPQARLTDRCETFF